MRTLTEVADEAVTERGRRAMAICAVSLPALVGAAALAVAVLVMSGGDEEDSSARRSAGRAAPPELPRGGRTILPGKRVVAFYGAPQNDELGTLGVGSLDHATRRLRRRAASFQRPRRPVLPAVELISTVASASPGDDGKYRYRQSERTIRKHLRGARRARALLILDIQPGREDFMAEVRRLEPFLAEPDVGLALDPEWSVHGGQLPGRQLGSTNAAKINEVSAYLSRLVQKRRLPQKLLVVHQFVESAVRRRGRIRTDVSGVAVLLNADGFGAKAEKRAKYRDLTGPRDPFFHGFKLFFKEDRGLMSPKEVLGLRPRPDLIVYE